MTPLLVHHANRQLAVGEAMELSHLAYSGLEQFARQFILINRSQAYWSNGVHDLWVWVGGSIGHGGLWNVHIDEGVVDADFGGRRWEVTVQTPGEVAADRVEQQKQKLEKARKGLQAEEVAVLKVVDAHAQDPPTHTVIRSETGYSNEKARQAIQRLVESGEVEEVEYEKGVGNGALRTVTGYRRPDQENTGTTRNTG